MNAGPDLPGCPLVVDGSALLPDVAMLVAHGAAWLLAQ
jgi:hypothetical protein